MTQQEQRDRGGFGFGSRRDRAEAENFYRELMGGGRVHRRTSGGRAEALDEQGSSPARRRLSLFDFNPSFTSGFRLTAGNPSGYNMDTALLDAFAAARIDDYSLVRTITFDGGTKPPKWGGFSPLGDSREAMRIDYLQRLTAEMHRRGAQVFVGYEMVERGTTVSQAGTDFRNWLASATDAQLVAHGRAIVSFFTSRTIPIDGVGFDIELNGLSVTHGPKLKTLFEATAAAMATARPGGVVYYDTAPFAPRDGAGTISTMLALKYALAGGAANLIARPMCYNGTVASRAKIAATIDCALAPTSAGGGGLAPGKLQLAIDVSRTSELEMVTMCGTLFRPKGVGMTIYTMPGGAAQAALLRRARNWEAALNPGAAAPSAGRVLQVAAP
jgi:hypothetical protein